MSLWNRFVVVTGRDPDTLRPLTATVVRDDDESDEDDGLKIFGPYSGRWFLDSSRPPPSDAARRCLRGVDLR